VYYGQDIYSREYLRFVALGIFLLGVLSDAVDGYIARKAKQQSQAGMILDPLGDKLLLMSAYICLYMIPLEVRFPLPVILVVISRDVLILLGAVVIFIVRQEINVAPTKWGKLTTTFQMLAVILVLLQWPYSYFCWWTAVFFTSISGIDYVMRGFKLLYNNSTGSKLPV
jgi:CDP-diacylglycerol--glycerol-3-phosphate 3-phosphatidyltransferase